KVVLAVRGLADVPVELGGPSGRNLVLSRQRREWVRGRERERVVGGGEVEPEARRDDLDELVVKLEHEVVVRVLEGVLVDVLLVAVPFGEPRGVEDAEHPRR